MIPTHCPFFLGTIRKEVMARLKPSKHLINLKDRLSQKVSISEFKKLLCSLRKEMDNYASCEK